ncbi:fumarylacetoacetate hydrolase family protein [Microbacterium elymi]|uniref:fumarylacetoacetate hydrolase family protein n=1 Tax=Microbacterium elymi TaxID=2909587 RepID=UPI003F493351
MRLARFTPAGSDVVRVGRIDGDEVVDLTAVAGAGGSVRELLPRLPELTGVLAAASGPRFALAGVRLHAPIDDPQKYLGIGMNYREHAEEAAAAGIPTPTSQLWFNKQVTCIVGPQDDIVKPSISEELDYEIELGVVIGQRCRHVAVEDARSVIAGYLVANDVSVRDWLAEAVADLHAGQVVRHARSDRAVADHRRRDRGPAEAADAADRERRGAPGLPDLGHDLRHLRADRLPLAGVHADAGRHPGHRHSGGDRSPDGPVPAPRRCGPRRDRGPGRHREPGRCGRMRGCRADRASS